MVATNKDTVGTGI